MPYITLARAAELRVPDPDTLPELAFILCEAVDNYIGIDVDATKIIGALGALEEAKAELIRRVGNPYEYAAQGRTRVDPFALSAQDGLD
jgi:hypothetical protein